MTENSPYHTIAKGENVQSRGCERVDDGVKWIETPEERKMADVKRVLTGSFGGAWALCLK